MTRAQVENSLSLVIETGGVGALLSFLGCPQFVEASENIAIHIVGVCHVVKRILLS
jgi:hypothetical protein